MDAPLDQRDTRGAKGVPKPGLFGTSFDTLRNNRSRGAMKDSEVAVVVVEYLRGALPRGAGHPRGINPRVTEYQRCIKEVTDEATETNRS